MSIPKFYHNDQLRVGVLSGTNSGAANDPSRVADGDISLVYLATSGATPSGSLTVTLSGTPVLPSALVLVKVAQASGYTLTLESEDIGGGNNTTVVNSLLGDIASGVFPISGSSAREVWRITFTGSGGFAPLRAFELMLADEYTLPRTNQVGVTRTRQRQFTRIGIPGGQPFTQRQGPNLRRTRYSFVVVSGAEVSGLASFVDDIGGGEFFYHTDDLGQSYWAELLGQEQPFSDAAGVFTVDMAVQEIQTDDS